MPAEYPVINGSLHDFSSIELKILNKNIVGSKEINYEEELGRTDVYGAYAQKIGRTRGQLKPTGSLTLYHGEFIELVDLLGDGFYETAFDAIVNYRDEGQPMVTDSLFGCMIVKPQRGHSQGGDALEVKLDLNIMKISWNGKFGLKKMR